MDGNRGGRRDIRQSAAVVPAVLFVRVRYVEPGYRAAAAHVRFHAETESRMARVEAAWNAKGCPAFKREADVHRLSVRVRRKYEGGGTRKTTVEEFCFESGQQKVKMRKKTVQHPRRGRNSRGR